MANRNVRVVNNNGSKPNVKYFPKTASTALDRNSLVELTSGTLGAADDNETIVLGVLLKEIASTDSDYASTTKVPVEVLRGTDEVEIDTTAALTVGTSYGISNAYTVDQADTTNDVFTCTVAISATRARGFLKGIAGGNTV